MTTRPNLAATATRIPTTDYGRPAARRAGALRLDGNEGSAPSADVLASLAAADPRRLRDYPSTDGVAAALATRFGIGPERVVVTAGADDALDRVCRSFLEPGQSIVLPVPTFEMLHRFVTLAGGTPLPVRWSDRFPTDGVLAAVRRDTRLLAVVSPNNPTGAAIGRDEFARLAETIPDRVILLDHAYVEYADDDLTALALTYPNVVVVRTLSKAWGLAGCRVGYALASADMAALLRRAGNPYPVSALSVAVVEAALSGNDAPLEQHVARVRSERARVQAKLTSLGVEVRDTQANFVFPDFGDRAEFVFEALQFAGVVTRRFPHREEIATAIRISMPGEEAGLTRLTAALDLALDPQALLLDMDGVLADVRDSYRACVIRTAASYGVTVTYADIQAQIRSGNANNDWELTRRLLRAQGVEAPVDEIMERYQRHYLGDSDTAGLRESERLLPLRETLTALRRGRSLAVVTGRPRDEAEWFLERHGIGDVVDAMVCFEDGPIKPDPFPVRRALEVLGCEHAWMVGDTPDDVRAAEAAGVVPIGTVAPGDDPTRMRRALLDAGAVTVISNLETLTEWLP